MLKISKKPLGNPDRPNKITQKNGKELMDDFVKKISPNDIIFLFHDDAVVSIGKKIGGFLDPNFKE